MYKLYFVPGACSLAPHLVLEEAKLPHELVLVDLRNKTYAGGDYKKINPKGSVPALQLDNGEVLTEAAVILQYLSDQKPEAKLLPQPGTKERYHALEWLNYIATEVHKGFSAFWNPQTPAETKTMVTQVLMQRFAYLDEHLAKNEFILGSNYSVADAYLFTVTNWAFYHKLDMSPHKNVLAFLERVKARPATLAAMKAEGLLK